MVFDEIDAGIGGTTAHAVAETLRRLAERAQVVTITHLPQIATAADRHFRVEKVPGDPTHTRIERSTTSSAATSSSACSAARSSSRRSNADGAAGSRRLSDAAPSMRRVRGLRALVRSKPVSFITDRGGL